MNPCYCHFPPHKHQVGRQVHCSASRECHFNNRWNLHFYGAAAAECCLSCYSGTTKIGPRVYALYAWPFLACLNWPSTYYAMYCSKVHVRFKIARSYVYQIREQGASKTRDSGTCNHVNQTQYPEVKKRCGDTATVINCRSYQRLQALNGCVPQMWHLLACRDLSEWPMSLNKLSPWGQPISPFMWASREVQ